MNVPIKWLKDFVDINVSVEELSNALTMSGTKVEGIERPGSEITNVVVGKILSIEKHPNADKLVVTKVDTGKEVLQIVTGASNITEGDCVPVALDGSTLAGGVKIKKSKLRGVESQGMLCSIQELGLTKNDYPEADEDGIFILNKQKNIDEYTLGQDIKEVIGYDDEVIELEITSNRPDCLSVLGVGREAAAALKTKFKKPVITVKEELQEKASDYVDVEIKAPELCSRFTARVVKDVKIEPSPDWMRKRLRAAGVRPINNIVDITNYVMLELGQPMHAYDINNVKDGKIIVRRAEDGEIIKTLDGQDRILDSSMLIIADSEKPIGVAGVMGGEYSGINPETKVVILESANFNGVSVRLTAKKLGMRTEASSRFEKGLDVENALVAMERAAQLIEELGAGKVCTGVIDCYPVKQEKRELTLRPEKINAFLGTSIDTDTMIEILESLEFAVDRNSLKITVPGFRRDVEREADIAEEIARLYDYNKIEATLLKGKSSTVGRKTKKQKIEDIVRNTMVSCGLSETYTYSFTSPKVFDRLRVAKDDPLRKVITISNPLGEDYSIMRTTTIPDMLGVISRNYNRQIEEAGFFELSYVYIPKELPLKELPIEKQVLTIGMYGEVDFYDIKGIVEELLDVLKIKDYRFVPERDNKTFHPGRTARLVIAGEDAGLIGEIHPEVSEEFETPERTYIGIIEIEPLVKNAVMKVEYKQLPRYPSVTRDIAILVNDEVLAWDIEQTIKENGGKTLEDIKLFDVYKGKQVPEGFKSMAYSITFRAVDRTLTDDEVNKSMAKIVAALEKRYNARLR
ncbi:MAG TPA: phenylalanine--tRNA ligase subunit beta [Clostridiaceae bacterium]|nr:phenylalanine--tRNA ligase subunit beta [Clostridiaceae bacterium]